MKGNRDDWYRAPDDRDREVIRYADPTHRPRRDWTLTTIAVLCAVGVLYIATQIVRAAFTISFGAAALAVIGGLGALLMLAVFVGSFIREGGTR